MCCVLFRKWHARRLLPGLKIMVSWFFYETTVLGNHCVMYDFTYRRSSMKKQILVIKGLKRGSFRGAGFFLHLPRVILCEMLKGI